MKVSEKLSTYSNNEFLQLKNTKFAIITIKKPAKNFETLLRVLWGKLTLEPPHMLSDTFFSGRLKFLGPLG